MNKGTKTLITSVVVVVVVGGLFLYRNQIANALGLGSYSGEYGSMEQSSNQSPVVQAFVPEGILTTSSKNVVPEVIDYVAPEPIIAEASVVGNVSTSSPTARSTVENYFATTQKQSRGAESVSDYEAGYILSQGSSKNYSAPKTSFFQTQPTSKLPTAPVTSTKTTDKKTTVKNVLKSALNPLSLFKR